MVNRTRDFVKIWVIKRLGTHRISDTDRYKSFRVRNCCQHHRTTSVILYHECNHGLIAYFSHLAIPENVVHTAN